MLIITVIKLTDSQDAAIEEYVNSLRKVIPSLIGVEIGYSIKYTLSHLYEGKEGAIYQFSKAYLNDLILALPEDRTRIIHSLNKG